ncbi:EVE domain-containing protein [Marivivens marinus]|uniref:EVE domain-containing protein n=1 Tax=Marivivens marinus TaxID=3110173 RepID=UPI003B847D2F
MAKWLFKSEPDVFGWDDLVAKGAAGEEWDGVRNYQARNNMRAMDVGDLGFFYHSRSGLEIVGIVEVIAPAHPDSSTDDPRWDCVDVRALRPFVEPVSMQTIKADPRLADMVLVKNSRLSVQPVSDTEWQLICELGKTEP